MSEKRIAFTVKKDGGGAFTVETKDGFVGSQCETAVEAIIGSLGAKAVDGGDKEERYYNNDPNVLVDTIR